VRNISEKKREVLVKKEEEKKVEKQEGIEYI